MGTGGFGGVHPPWTPSTPLAADPQPPADQNTNLHYLFCTPGKKNAQSWKCSMKKCIKSHIYTISLWPSENLRETLEKNFAVKRLKMRFFENRFWLPTPVPTYVIRLNIELPRCDNYMIVKRKSSLLFRIENNWTKERDFSRKSIRLLLYSIEITEKNSIEIDKCIYSIINRSRFPSFFTGLKLIPFIICIANVKHFCNYLIKVFQKLLGENN